MKTARFIDGNRLQEFELMKCPCQCHRNPHIKHIAPCCKDGFVEMKGKTLPAPDCKFKVGEVYEEGKDYKVVRGKQIYKTDQQQWQEMSRVEKDECFEWIAVPIKAEESQDELWEQLVEFLNEYNSGRFEEYYFPKLELKSKFHITRKTPNQ